jgi:dTDP-4-amino-4,6-dideoxygalactose transaminase
MVLTDDPTTFNFLLNLRNNCKEDEHAYVGYNSKMSEADCAQMMVKLAHFDSWQKRRAAIAEYYNERLAAYVDLPGITAGTTCLAQVCDSNSSTGSFATRLGC